MSFGNYLRLAEDMGEVRECPVSKHLDLVYSVTAKNVYVFIDPATTHSSFTFTEQLWVKSAGEEDFDEPSRSG